VPAAGDCNGAPPSICQPAFFGCLWLFLVSCAITLFASLAQIVLLVLLLSEIFLNRELWMAPPAFALIVALCWYVAHSMSLTIKLQKEADGKAGQKLVDAVPNKNDQNAVAAAAARAQTAKGPLLTWPVL
jgi:hypothetical protein